MTLRGPDLSSLILMTTAGDRFKYERNVLRFQRYGDGWSLRQVVVAGSVRVLPAPKFRTMEMAKKMSSGPAIIEIRLAAFGRHLSSKTGLN